MILSQKNTTTDAAAIERAVMQLSDLVKAISVSRRGGHFHALIVPDLDAAKQRHIVNIGNEIRWYAVELYNIGRPENEKIAGYRIVDRLPSGTENSTHDTHTVFAPLSVTEIPPGDTVCAPMKAFLEERSARPVTPEAHIEFDLGLDSLQKVELMLFVERSFGVTMDESLLSQMMAVGDLCGYVRQRQTKAEPAAIEWRAFLREPTAYALPRAPWVLRLFRLFFRPLFRLYFRLAVTGTTHVKIPSPFIIAPSHQSMLDGFLIAAALPSKVLANTYFLEFALMWGHTIMRPLARIGQGILIDSNNGLPRSLQQSSGVLMEGHNLVIFPEGARSRDRRLLEFHRFFALLAQTHDLPVVPVVVDGGFEALRAGMFVPRPAKVAVRFLPPVRPRKDESAEAFTERVRMLIRDDLSAHALS